MSIVLLLAKSIIPLSPLHQLGIVGGSNFAGVASPMIVFIFPSKVGSPSFL